VNGQRPQRGFGQQRCATNKERDMAALTGKTALVTGASRGIGRAIARRLAADGALVAVHYATSQAAATQTVTAIQADGGRAYAVRAELGVAGDVDTLFARLEAGLSGQRLDILVNNAATRAAGFIQQTTPEEFDRMFAVNVRAPLFIVQRALPLLRDGGRIINVSSSDTRVALPMELAYAMTKGAVNVMSQTLANALGARGITVNAVAPGPTDTDMTAFLRDPEVQAATASATALGRVGQPADIADAVAFLASDDARWITGHLLDVTGGMWLGPRM
jgi:3-oxoacyl-[acyl-carrier protein] reductase